MKDTPSTLDPQLEQNLRQAFKYLNRFMVAVYRLGLGGWLNSTPDLGGRIMILVHTGRKSGAQHRSGLNYAEVDGEIYCVAGFGATSDWYKNIQKNPQVQIWLPDGWWCGVTEDISESPRRLALVREVITASGFAGRAAGLDARSMTDEELDRATAPYRLIRIQRTEARTGAAGPGDLAWVWPAATCVLLAMLLTRRKK